MPKYLNAIVLLLFLINLSYSMSFHSGPVCENTFLKKVEKSENTVPLLIVVDSMIIDSSKSNYQYREVDSKEVIYVIQTSDSTLNSSLFEVKSKSALNLVKMKDGSWKSRGTYLLKDSKWMRGVFLTDKLPKFCREQTSTELNIRKSRLNNTFLGILLVPLVLITVLLWV